MLGHRGVEVQGITPAATPHTVAGLLVHRVSLSSRLTAASQRTEVGPIDWTALSRN